MVTTDIGEIKLVHEGDSVRVMENKRERIGEFIDEIMMVAPEKRGDYQGEYVDLMVQSTPGSLLGVKKETVGSKTIELEVVGTDGIQVKDADRIVRGGFYIQGATMSVLRETTSMKDRFTGNDRVIATGYKVYFRTKEERDEYLGLMKERKFV